MNRPPKPMRLDQRVSRNLGHLLGGCGTLLGGPGLLRAASVALVLAAAACAEPVNQDVASAEGYLAAEGGAVLHAGASGVPGKSDSPWASPTPPGDSWAADIVDMAFWELQDSSKDTNGSISEVKYRESPAPDCGNCWGKECGYDECGESCGTCTEGWSCTAEGKCVECVPDCDGKQCGDNGCQNVCGECGFYEMCVEFACVDEFGQACQQDGDCRRKHCVDHPDGGKVCSKNCNGNCGPGWTCKGSSPSNAVCYPTDCVRACGMHECGSDGCGGKCGFCLGWNVCGADGECYYPCEGECNGRHCGTNSCGNSCGQCGAGQKCDDAGLCVDGCQDQCAAAGTTCESGQLSTCDDGPQGCLTRTLSDCPSGTYCKEGACVALTDADTTPQTDTSHGTDASTDATQAEPSAPSTASGGCEATDLGSPSSAWALLLLLAAMALLLRKPHRANS